MKTTWRCWKLPVVVRRLDENYTEADVDECLDRLDAAMAVLL